MKLTKIRILPLCFLAWIMSINSSLAAETDKMTPQEALRHLKEGNQNFVTNKATKRDYFSKVYKASYGQHPWAVVLNCMDSRNVPEFFFDQGLADLFVLRVAGNVLDNDMLGSMEFATKAVGTPLIVVLGHDSCAAVSGACKGVNLGHLDGILKKIQPVVAASKKQAGTEDCSDNKLVDLIAKNNAMQVARQIKQQSPIIRELIAQGKVGIVAGDYNIRTGKVTFIEDKELLPLP